MLSPYEGILFETKKNELSSSKKTRKKHKCVLLSEKSQYEKAAYYMSPTIWHSGKGKPMETVKSLGRRRDKDLGASEMILYDTLSLDMSLDICQNPQNTQHKEGT